MAKNQFFRDVRYLAQRQGVKDLSIKSMNWYKEKMRDFTKRISREALLKDGRMKNRPTIGDMYFYFYDAKTKDKLPYWDRFPLTIVIGYYENGFLGINLHYLSPNYRAVLFNALVDILSNDRMDQTTKIAASYEVLNAYSKFSYFKPCIKRYLYDHVQTNYMRINSPDYLAAVFLPVAQFEKKSNSYVWGESAKMIKGG